MFDLEVSVVSGLGKIRSNNEDNVYFDGDYREEVDNPVFSKKAVFNTEKPHYFAVCDGMGGLENGEIASQKSVEMLGGYVKNNSPDKIKRILVAINEKIFYLGSEMDSQLGSTIVISCFEGDKAIVANLGDSRAYMYRDGKIVQISEDHTNMQSLKKMKDELKIDIDLDRKMIDDGLTQFLGVDPDEFEVEPFLTEIELKKNDIFILCSDGLTSMISDEDIQRIIADVSIDDDIAEALQNGAMDAGGKDNITICVIKVL